MNLYTLNSFFQKQHAIGQFISLIWTERYSDAGDFTLVIPAVPEFLSLVPLDTWVGLDDTNEVCLVESISIENGLATVTGRSMVAWLNQRVWRYTNVQSLTSYTQSGLFISTLIDYLVTEACQYGPIYPGYPGDGLVHAYEAMTNLTISGAPNDPGQDEDAIAVSFGPLFDIIQPLADTYKVGIRMYPLGQTDTTLPLYFDSYLGTDRSSNQTANPLVRFSPDTKTLDNTTELYSNLDYKNVCYAYASTMPTTIDIPTGATDANGNAVVVTHAFAPAIGVAYADVASKTSYEFTRRTMMIDVADFSIDNYTITTTTTVAALQAKVTADLVVAAKTALAQQKKVASVDGQTLSDSQYQYGRDYELGDIVELQGSDGLINRAHVTEYIRNEDNTGETAYPTLSVIT